MFKKEIPIPKMDYVLAGYWKPEAWLVLFFVILIGIIIVTAFGMGSPKKTTVQAIDSLDTKYGSFTGGEKEEFTQVAGHDLFWGLKHELKGYFSAIQNAHSGIVNDYVLWVVECLAIVSIYLFAVL